MATRRFTKAHLSSFRDKAVEKQVSRLRKFRRPCDRSKRSGLRNNDGPALGRDS